jgi:hypothetical protein
MHSLKKRSTPSTVTQQTNNTSGSSRNGGGGGGGGGGESGSWRETNTRIRIRIQGGDQVSERGNRQGGRKGVNVRIFERRGLYA